MKGKTEVIVFEDSSVQYDWPDTLVGFIEFWQENLELIPKEFSEEATIALEITEGYNGESDLNVKIAYFRPETEGEGQAREATKLARDEKEKARDLEIFKALKAKIFRINSLGGVPKPTS